MGVNWKPVQTRRGSAPRIPRTLSNNSTSRSPSVSVRSPARSPLGKSPRSRTITAVGDNDDVMSKYARGTNGPARPEGSDPRVGRGVRLSKSSVNPSRDSDDLNVRYAKGSRKPSAATGGRFAFAASDRRAPAASRTSVGAGTRPNPQYERNP